MRIKENDFLNKLKNITKKVEKGETLILHKQKCVKCGKEGNVLFPINNYMCLNCMMIYSIETFSKAAEFFVKRKIKKEGIDASELKRWDEK